MDDDFNTPKAIAAIFGLINDSKSEIDSLADEDVFAVREFLDDVGFFFGIDFDCCGCNFLLSRYEYLATCT